MSTLVDTDVCIEPRTDHQSKSPLLLFKDLSKTDTGYKFLANNAIAVHIGTQLSMSENPNLSTLGISLLRLCRKIPVSVMQTDAGTIKEIDNDIEINIKNAYAQEAGIMLTKTAVTPCARLGFDIQNLIKGIKNRSHRVSNCHEKQIAKEHIILNGVNTVLGSATLTFSTRGLEKLSQTIRDPQLAQFFSNIAEVVDPSKQDVDSEIDETTIPMDDLLRNIQGAQDTENSSEEI